MWGWKGCSGSASGRRLGAHLNEGAASEAPQGFVLRTGGSIMNLESDLASEAGPRAGSLLKRSLV